MNTGFNFNLPATRGIQAGREYYLMTIPMNALKRLISFDAGNVLDRSQREVEKPRATKIAKYIESNLQENQFYILPTLTGSIDKIEFIPSAASVMIGEVSIPMSAVVSLFDGQHRATGIIEACANNGEISESISLLLYPNLSLEERKQAFSDINDNAKKPSKALAATYNVRDRLAQMAVKVASECAYFVERTDFEKNLITGSSAYSFSVKAVKDAIQKMLGLKGATQPSWDDYEKVCTMFSAWEEVLGFDMLSNMSASDFREIYITASGVMLQVIARVSNVMLAQMDAEAAACHIMELGQDEKRLEPHFWSGILVCPTTGRAWLTKAAIEAAVDKWLELLKVERPVEETPEQRKDRLEAEREIAKTEKAAEKARQIAERDAEKARKAAEKARLAEQNSDVLTKVAKKTKRAARKTGAAAIIDAGVKAEGEAAVITDAAATPSFKLPELFNDAKFSLDAITPELAIEACQVIDTVARDSVEEGDIVAFSKAIVMSAIEFSELLRARSVRRIAKALIEPEDSCKGTV